jgi:hypothetical protein
LSGRILAEPTRKRGAVGSNDASAPQFDDVLKRMLSSPPQPHVKKKPAGKPAQRKPR